VIGEARPKYPPPHDFEGFANRVKEYLDSQLPAGRSTLCDEGGASSSVRNRSACLNLPDRGGKPGRQPTKRRASGIRDLQADLEGILGEEEGAPRPDDLSKIQGRFRTKLTLASADVTGR